MKRKDLIKEIQKLKQEFYRVYVSKSYLTAVKVNTILACDGTGSVYSTTTATGYLGHYYASLLPAYRNLTFKYHSKNKPALIKVLDSLKNLLQRVKEL